MWIYVSRDLLRSPETAGNYATGVQLHLKQMWDAGLKADIDPSRMGAPPGVEVPVTLPSTSKFKAATISVPRWAIQSAEDKDQPKKTSTDNTTNKGDCLMSKLNLNLASLVNSFFQKIDACVYDLQTGSLGIKTPQGILTLKSDDTLQINPLEMFSMPIPAFALRTQLNQVAKGDIVIAQNRAVFCCGAFNPDTKTIAVINADGAVSNIAPPVNVLLGQAGILVVKNMFSGGAMNGNPLMAALILGELDGSSTPGGGFDFKKLMLLQMMGGNVMGGGMGAMNPMMAMALMGDGLGSGMKDIVMMQMLTNGGFNLFGAAAPAATSAA